MAAKPKSGDGKPRKKNDPRNIPGMKAKMWKPGQSGNPKGPPRRKTLEAHVEELMDEKIGRGKDAITRREALATLIVDELMKRNMKLLRTYMDRVWPEVQEHNLSMKGPVQVVLDDQDVEPDMREDLEDDS